MISIITPFLNGLDLLTDYDAATQGAEVVIVDNGSDTETADALAALPKERGRVIRNEKNIGFAAANNQGYAAATGDVIVFLNSDIAADPAWLQLVADDVRYGALYGPSLAQQLIAGRWLPYIEGWCIAATRATWEKLKPGEINPERVYPPYQLIGPWDSRSYPGPYWEDNDLCLRAMQAGIALIQTTWPIQHKGGRSAGPLATHAASFAANERTFTERVLSVFGNAALAPGYHSEMYARYMQLVHTQTDIQHHLPLLYSLARGNVVELGTRSGVSTAALLAGVERHSGHVWSVDLDDCSQVAARHPQWTFVQGDSTDGTTISQVTGNTVDCINFLLIDTFHAYEQTSAELSLWWPYLKPGGHICLHDPETFPGVRRAVTEFCAAHDWPVTFVLPCHGMAVIEVPVTKDAPADPGVSLEGAAWAMEASNVV